MKNDPAQLSAEECRLLKKWVEETPLGEVAKTIGVAIATLTRAAAGLPCRPGSILMIRAALAKSLVG